MNSRFLVSRCLRQLQRTSFLRNEVPCHVRMISCIPVSHDKNTVSIPKLQSPNLETRRYKSKKKAKKGQQQNIDSDDENDEEDEEDEMGAGDALPGEQEKIIKLAQVRVDKVLRLAFNNSRIVEEAFVEGRLRKNDDKVIKKSTPVQEGDILDIEIGPDPKRPDFLKVHRVEILEVKDGVHCAVRILICKNLTIKSYDT
ncbi:Mitochondrial transcription rescue factor 1 [Frankliniella fusca]|uniref:Mitochondrial transcription rescue factor 1 n=1 Tax=Frankliniella fusca TaxID=407009 RepID=A0AAE1LF92_9NEOP|nr:Mitochondrial transcription rescue factor 1 [Frankliniella fusca]